jgi:hypothetical protein
MRIQSVQINMEALGAQFANMDDDEQAAFFKGLSEELKNWPSTYQGQMQFCAVGNLLTNDQKEILEKTVSIIFEKKEENK